MDHRQRLIWKSRQLYNQIQSRKAVKDDDNGQRDIRRGIGEKPELVPKQTSVKSTSVHPADGNSTLTVNKVPEMEEVTPPSEQLIKPKMVSTCCVCNGESAGYCCPKCFEKYCGVSCFTAHRRKDCARFVKRNNLKSTTGKRPSPGTISDNPEKKPKPTYTYPSDSTVSLEKLEMLATGDNLVKLKEFLKDKTLCDWISILDSTKLPHKDFKAAVDYEPFLEFTQFVLGILDK